MNEILNGEITYPRMPDGGPLNRIVDVPAKQKGFIGGTTNTRLLISQEHFVSDLENAR